MSLLQISGSDFHVIHEGEGTPVVFVHGFPLSGAMWKHQRHRIPFDAPSRHSRTCEASANPRPPRPPNRSTITRTTSGACWNVLRISEPVVLCGLLGGYIAFRFWEKFPERVRALILCDTKAAADSPEAAQGRLALADRVLKEGSRVAADAVAELFDSATLRSVIDETQKIMLATSPEAIAVALRAMVRPAGSTPLLKTITVPTLVIAGAEDLIIKPDEMKAMAAAIPNAEFATIPLAGHMAPLEQPHAANAVMRRFLASL